MISDMCLQHRISHMVQFVISSMITGLRKSDFQKIPIPQLVNLSDSEGYALVSQPIGLVVSSCLQKRRQYVSAVFDEVKRTKTEKGKGLVTQESGRGMNSVAAQK